MALFRPRSRSARRIDLHDGDGACPGLEPVLHATVDSKLLRPGPPCPGDAYRCGDAFVDGFGAAYWLFEVTSFSVVSESCLEYTAIVRFTLADGSTLTLDEAGMVCGPGKSFFATPPFSWGNPDRAHATWQVLDGTGQFAGIFGGSGASSLRSAGAAVVGTYSGIIEE